MLKLALVMLGVSAKLTEYGRQHGLKELLNVLGFERDALLAKAPTPTESWLEGGACSADDIAMMNQAGSGNAANSFPGMVADCGKHSWSLMGGFLSDKFDQCLTSKINISTPCANCFAGAGNYGYQHCKTKCMFSWCSQQCLDCSVPYDATLYACVGTDQIPPATTC